MDERRWRHLICHAMRQPDRFLTAALAEETDESLAALVGCRPARVWHLRLMSWPRAARRDHAIAGMAALIGADAARLAALFQHITVSPSPNRPPR